MELILDKPIPTSDFQLRFQNNIQSIFSRVRLLYGATPLEDIINYNVIVRNLTEWTGTNQSATLDQTSIAEGIGGMAVGGGFLGTDKPFSLTGAHTRCDLVQGFRRFSTIRLEGGTSGVEIYSAPNAVGTTANPKSTRRYQVNLALGLFTQDKLVRFLKKLRKKDSNQIYGISTCFGNHTRKCSWMYYLSRKSSGRHRHIKSNL